MSGASHDKLKCHKTKLEISQCRYVGRESFENSLFQKCPTFVVASFKNEWVGLEISNLFCSADLTKV